MLPGREIDSYQKPSLDLQKFLCWENIKSIRRRHSLKSIVKARKKNFLNDTKFSGTHKSFPSFVSNFRRNSRHLLLDVYGMESVLQHHLSLSYNVCWNMSLNRLKCFTALTFDVDDRAVVGLNSFSLSSSLGIEIHFNKNVNFNF